MTSITRRDFCGRLAALAAAAPTLTAAPSRAADRLRLSFSTLGCPRWSWTTVLDRAVEYGFAGVELRGLEGEMDLTKRPEFSGSRIAQSRRDVESRGLRIVGLGASSRLHEPDEKVRAAQLDEARRFIDLAHGLGAPYVRVFPDRRVADEPPEATLDRIAGGLRELARHGKGSGVTVLLESHGDFTESATLARIIELTGGAGAALLWDTHHTFVAGREEPAASWKQIGRFVRHTHLKDSVDEGGKPRYVLTGEGRVPIRGIVSVLASAGYEGFYGFEWEKAWHPEIPEPEVAFPHFAKVMRALLVEKSARR